jgi:hypothetical protein
MLQLSVTESYVRIVPLYMPKFSVKEQTCKVDTHWRMKKHRREALYSILNEMYEAVFLFVTERNVQEGNIFLFFL